MMQARTPDTRQRVIDAARGLRLDRGIAAVTLKDITRASGVSNGSIFHHFGSKEGVIREIFVAERRPYLGPVADEIIGFDGDPCDAFAHGARVAAQYQLANPDRYARLVADFSEGNWLRDNAALRLETAGDIHQPVIDGVAASLLRLRERMCSAST